MSLLKLSQGPRKDAADALQALPFFVSNEFSFEIRAADFSESLGLEFFEKFDSLYAWILMFVKVEVKLRNINQSKTAFDIVECLAPGFSVDKNKRYAFIIVDRFVNEPIIPYCQVSDMSLV